jgi:hypothetical protein
MHHAVIATRKTVMFANVINQFIGEVTRRPRDVQAGPVDSWEHLYRYGSHRAARSRAIKLRWRKAVAALTASVADRKQ